VAEPTAARGVEPGDLGSYQHAVRLVLTNDLITEERPRVGALAAVLRWADAIARDFADLLGYTLVATTRQVRLVRKLDSVDPTQRTIFVTRSGRPFDRRRLAYLCLVLAVFQRSRIEISLADLVRALAPNANAIAGLGFDATITEHKRAIVDAVDWLCDRGALRLSDGSAEIWAHDTERGDALYDIDHDVCSLLFRPGKPIQQLTGVTDLLEPAETSGRPTAQRDAAARRARRLLIEHPVLYYGCVDADTATALRDPGLADNLARLTGLVVERRAEGVMLVDPTDRFTDHPFPGRGGAVNRAAGLLLAKFADLLEDPDTGPAGPRMPVPSAVDDLQDLAERIDAGLHPVTGGQSRPENTRTGEEPLNVPFIDRTSCESMLKELYDEFGAASFTVGWQFDQPGLLDAATRLLDDLRLARRLPGGVLLLPAAARYRNITAALPGNRDGQGAFKLEFSPEVRP
jgi:uncharacterized protein (TIGR02678 family)